MNIFFSYDNDFCELMSSLEKKYGKKLFELDGIGKKQLDINDFSKQFFTNRTTTADVSIDANSNITQSDIITYNVELPKPFFRLNAYFILWKKLKQLYGQEEANRIIEMQLSGDVYINDFHGLQAPYCFNYSTYDIALLGLPFITKIKSIPPKHLYSFKSQLEQFVVYASNSTLGACLYKNQELIVKENNIIKVIKVKDFVSKYDLNNKFVFNLQEWENSDNINNVKIWENGKFVELKRVFRRRYNRNIYKIETHSGKKCFVSEDHVFKVLFRGRELEIKAKDLRIYDTVFNTFISKLPIDKNSFDYQMGQFIGIVNGDGYIGKKEVISISINYKEKFIIDFLDNFLSIYFNMKGKLLKGNKCYQYNIYSTKFRNKIINMYFKGSIIGKNKYAYVDEESIEFKLGYIDGLLVTDGSYKDGHTLSLISEKTIENVINILYSIGFKKLNIHKYDDIRTNTRCTSYIIKIPVKINDYLNLTLIKRKNAIKNNNSNKTKEIFYTGLHAYYNANNNKIARNIVTTGNITHKRKSLYRSLTTDVIVNIEIIPNDDDYVYEVETSTHWYSAGGILTHNCGLADVFITTSYYIDKMIRTGVDAKFKLNNEEDVWTYVKENIVSLIYTLNQPFRGGHQCVTEDTEILTVGGFKKYNELSVGENIYTWNNGVLNIQPIQKLNIYDYDGIMHEYKGRDTIQIVTPGHNVLHKKNNSSKYILTKSSKLVDKKTPLNYPVAMLEDNRKDYDISDSMLQLLTFILTDGILDLDNTRGERGRIQIFKSPKRWGNKQLINVLNKNNIVYTVSVRKSNFGGIVNVYNISTNSSQKLLKLINRTKKELPKWFFKLSRRQAKIVIDTWAKLGGNIGENNYNRQKLQCDNYLIADQIQHLCFLSGKGSSIESRTISNNKQEIIYVKPYSRTNKSASIKNKIHYKGKVFCPTTEDGVVVFRKNGKIFISGNSAFTNISIFDDNFLNELVPEYKFINEKGEQVIPKFETVKKTQEIFLDVMNEELTRTPVTFPVTTACISVDEDNNPKDQKFIKMIAEKNKQFGFINIYCGKTSTLSSCCRLRSDADNEYFNAFGSGSVKIGSLGVVTTNLPRLAIKSKTKEKFLENLRELVIDVARINNAKRHIIKKRIEVGVSPLYSLGFMSIDKQYSTFGITGLNEAIELLGYDILEQDGQQLVLDMLEIINKTNDKLQKQYNAPHNCEQVPAENSGIKLSKKDKLLKYTEDSLFYSNQFIPLIKNADMLDRIKLQGMFDSKFSGGAILHLNIEEQIVDTQKIIDLINICAKMGVVYWAVNYNLQMCEANHMSVGANGKCPVCGKPIKENFTRVVGFLTNIKNWNSVRRNVDYPNRQFYKNI